MAVTYSSTVKDSRMTAVRDAIDGGTGAGTLEICTSGYASVLATITFSDPCGTVASGVLTFSSMPKTTTATATGTPALARIKDSSGLVICDGLTVGTSGTDVVIDSETVTTNQTVSLTVASIAHA